MGQVVRKKVWFYGYDPVEQVVCRLPRSGENKMTRSEERPKFRKALSRISLAGTGDHLREVKKDLDLLNVRRHFGVFHE